MVRSKATTVEAYLAELPPERREVVAAVRELVLKNLPRGYREAMNWGMISYEIPLETYPHTYNKQPLSYAALAAQKNYYALYLMAVYDGSGQDARLREAFRQAGKKIDLGKSCLRFRRYEDVPWDAVAEVIRSTGPQEMIALYEQSRRGRDSPPRSQRIT